VVDLAYDEAGAGPAVVLIHGHPFNRSMWAPQVAALSDGYRVIAPDLRGYGDSPVTPGTVPMSQLAADVAALLDRLGAARAAVVGLSMGGLVAMELAIADPARWWALGLVATTAQPPGPGARNATASGRWPKTWPPACSVPASTRPWLAGSPP
jgi:pimeloyl-ACP methyl ester carboxylesterase